MDKIPRSDRLATIRPLLHSDEVVLDHGLALWKEVAQVLGQPHATGFITATDRRLIFYGEQTKKPTSMPYPIIRNITLARHLLSADLTIEFTDGQVATFHGGKGFYADLVKIIRDRRATPPPHLEQATLSYQAGKISMTCNACGGSGIKPGWAFCPACMRSIDWAASADVLDNYKQAMAKAGE